MGKPFSIQFVKKVDSDNSMGSMDGAHRVIKVQAGLSAELIADTILHEVCHAILYLTGMSEILRAIGPEGADIEEAVVLALENGLGTVYKLELLQSLQ